MYRIAAHGTFSSAFSLGICLSINIIMCFFRHDFFYRILANGTIILFFSFFRTCTFELVFSIIPNTVSESTVFFVFYENKNFFEKFSKKVLTKIKLGIIMQELTLVPLVSTILRACWNRQTGTFEGRVLMACGFKSHCSHHYIA